MKPDFDLVANEIICDASYVDDFDHIIRNPEIIEKALISAFNAALDLAAEIAGDVTMQKIGSGSVTAKNIATSIRAEKVPQ